MLLDKALAVPLQTRQHPASLWTCSLIRDVTTAYGIRGGSAGGDSGRGYARLGRTVRRRSDRGECARGRERARAREGKREQEGGSEKERQRQRDRETETERDERELVLVLVDACALHCTSWMPIWEVGRYFTKLILYRQVV